MKNDKIKTNKVSIIFIFSLLITSLILELLLNIMDPVGTLNIFSKNDFEKTCLSHQENSQERKGIYDKVFFGNSTVIAAYAEENTNSGYINMGMDYATIKDLSQLLEGDFVNVSKELVIGLNYLALLDTFDTNPSYIWHKRVWEPYLYFQRDRLHSFITEGVKNVLVGQPIVTTRYTDLNKYYYFGMLSNEELDEKIEVHAKQYWSLSISQYQGNMNALREITNYCKQRGIRLRCVWMPWNPYVDKPESILEVEEQANQILKEADIDVLNLSYSFPRECFHDLGHLNYEIGRKQFTEVIDKWLKQR